MPTSAMGVNKMFKVGDKVRVTNGNNAGGIPVGMQGVVEYADNDGTVRVDWQKSIPAGSGENGSMWWIGAKYIELACNPTIIHIGDIHLNKTTIKFEQGRGVVTSTHYPDGAVEIHDAEGEVWESYPKKHEGLYIHVGLCVAPLSPCEHNKPHEWGFLDVGPYHQCEEHGCVPYTEAK